LPQFKNFAKNSDVVQGMLKYGKKVAPL